MPDPARREKITRNREFRACIECRKRKLRCDRQLPCGACLRRTDPASCNYERNGRRGPSQSELKLERLEQLVRALQTQHDVHPAPASTVLAADPGHASNGQPSQAVHTGATHWLAMLEGIDELRATLGNLDENDEHSDTSSAGTDAVGVLFGATPTIPLPQLLARFLPPREHVDGLVAAYFQANSIAAPFLHSTQFSRLYGQFWEEPALKPLLWISILFSILDIASRTLARGPAADSSGKYAIAAAHCLALGEYYRPHKFAVEALLLFCQARCITNIDTTPEIVSLLGLVVRMAFTMGYHRDARIVSPSASAFEAEMRRRTWSLCMQLDVIISFQAGIPSNVHLMASDTMAPSNLYAADFDESSTELPKPRPDTDITDISFYIAKHRLMGMFERILLHSLNTSDAKHDEVRSLSQQLRDMYESFPPSYRVRYMADSVVDSPAIVVTRLCLHFIYQKSVCVLHRQHVVEGRHESIKAVYDAASAILFVFLDMYKKFAPGGWLETERWYLGSITWHDFLLGCTALCLTLCVESQSALGNTGVVDMTAALQLLRKARVACDEFYMGSQDIRKVRRLIEATVGRFSGEGIETANAHWANLDNSLPPDNLGWWDENMGMDDVSWEYMEEFLDLSDSADQMNGS